MKSIAPILIGISALFSGCASIPEKAWSPVVAPPYGYAKFQTQEGPFVVIPFGIGAFVGSPLMLVTTPLSLLCDTNEGGEAEIGKDMGFMLLGPVVVGDIVGTPFLAVKKTLWDFPLWAFGNEEKETLSNQANEPTSASAGEAVDIWAEVLSFPFGVEVEHAFALVIGQEEDDVWLLGFGVSARGQ
jgi:hypothetical protein